MSPVTLTCAECGVTSSDDAKGWRAYLDDEDQVVMFCASCAVREFGCKPEAEASQENGSE
jgi:hypothetical protein